jgi:demethylmenaquinone methyltransferase/2-methoxy-6-polyprenyl-1,4-benzoquinol methylase
VDCRPIDTEGVVVAAGFTTTAVQNLEIWTMPVRIVIGKK